MLTHDKIERNVGLFIVLTILTISVGGLLEIVPLFFRNPRPRQPMNWSSLTTR